MSLLSVARPPAAAGMVWFKDGWRLFRMAPIPWMGMAAMSLLAVMFIGSLPYAGSYLVELLSPFLVAGFMSASRAARNNEPVTFFYLADGFREALQPLAVVGVVYLLAGLLVDQVMRAMGGEGFQEMLMLAQTPQTADPEQARAVLKQIVPALLAGMALFTPALLATWFAPALVLFDRYPPGRAMYWSLWACVVNWRPMALYTLALTGIGMLAMMIPFGLGLLVFVPLALLSSYAAYEGMFVRQDVAA